MSKIFVAEIKEMSPFGFKSNYSYDDLKYLAVSNGDWVSVHIDALWSGSPSLITNVKNYKQRVQQDNKKILAKGIHISDFDIERSIQYGADYILVVGRVPDKKYLPNCLLEPLNLKQVKEFSQVPDIYGIVFNYRNLFSGLSNENIGSWVDEISNIPKRVKVFQASGIKRPDDIQKWADGYIVGEHLPQFLLSRQLTGLVNN